MKVMGDVQMCIRVQYDGQELEVEVVEYDPKDDYQPYLFQLPDGTQVWIPIDELSLSNRADLRERGGE